VQNHRVLSVDLENGQVAAVAGTGRAGYSGDGGPASEACLNEPYEVRFDGQGNMYFVEMKNHLVRRVDARSGKISTVAGTGVPGDSGDGGLAVHAQFRQPHSIALDDRGKLYIADIGNHRIRWVDLRSGIVRTLAGTGQRQLPVDGQRAHGNPLLGPRALAVHGDDLWIALREGHSVWRLARSTGILHHVAGSGEKGYRGDGGPALQATFNGPKGIAVGPDQAVYVVDTENQAIRRIDLVTKHVSTVAGSGRRGGEGDGGPATQAALARPHGICVGPDGAIYIGDTENHRVRVVVSEDAD
jgi:DNA-binding beta-propeller fold protein YncE